MKMLVHILGMSILFYSFSVTAQNTQAPTPREVAAKIYAQCMAVADTNAAQQQKNYCECTAQKLSQQVGAPANNLNQTGNVVLDDPRFIQIVSHCFSMALAQKNQAPAMTSGGTETDLPATESGIIGKPFSGQK